MHDLAREGAVEGLKDAVAAGNVLSTTDGMGNTALMAAIMAQQWDLSLIHISEPTRPY